MGQSASNFKSVPSLIHGPNKTNFDLNAMKMPQKKADIGRGVGSCKTGGIDRVRAGEIGDGLGISGMDRDWKGGSYINKEVDLRKEKGGAAGS
jgi:hypothetical protein